MAKLIYQEILIFKSGGIQWDQKVRHEDINVGGKYYWAQNEYQDYAISS